MARRKTWWVAAAAMLLVVVVVAAFVIGQRTGTRDEATTRTSRSPSASPSASTPSPEFSGKLYEIKAGSGGSSVAKADGTTPVGYDPSCRGAIQAATNYNAALGNHVYVDMSKKDYDALLDEINGGLDSGVGKITTMKKDAKPKFFTKTYRKKTDLKKYVWTTHPSWGLFKVVRCTKGSGATIDLIAAGTRPVDEKKAYLSAQRVSLTWYQGDWRLVGMPDESPDSPLDASDELTSTPAAPVSQKWRRRAKMLGQGNWMEYANAPG